MKKSRLKFGGGAGYGPPANRDPATIDDLRNGYITSAFAKQYYGVSGEGEQVVISGKRIRVGVDVGEHVADFVLVDEKRDLIFTGKRLTTPEDPGLAITDGLERLVSESGTSVPELDAVLVHGDPRRNTIIERKGAKVGLIPFQSWDSLEMGRML